MSLSSNTLINIRYTLAGHNNSRFIVVFLAALNFVVAVADCETTFTYQVSASEDNATANQWSQYAGPLTVGYRDEEPPPFSMSAMRFRNINIPHATVIVDARLKIRAHSNPITGQTLYGVIHAEDVDNPDDFSERYIKDIVKTSAAVNWDHSSYWETAHWYTSPDISTVVQEVIDRPGWSSGNAMVITYSNRLSDGEARNFCSYDFGSQHTSGPKLEITCLYLRKLCGLIESDEGTPIEGVLVSAGNEGGSDTTDSDGYYELFVQDGWSGIVTPSKDKWRFEPESLAYSNVTTDLPNQDYTAFAPLLISGYVSTAERMSVEAVAVSADNGGGSTTTNSDGYYEFLVPDGWSGAVTPSKIGFTFCPRIRSYDNVTEDKSNESYTILVTKVKSSNYQVAAGADDAYAWAHNSQSLSGTLLDVGYDYWTHLYTAPYYMTGMRFTNVQVPRSAVITDAHLKMQNTIFVLMPGYPVYGIVHAEPADNPGDFASVKVGQRSKTSNSVNWDHLDMGGSEWWYTSPDISTVLQEVIDRHGWIAGNALVILYSNRRNEGQDRWFKSYEAGTDNAPKLKITCAEPAVSGDIDGDGDVNLVDLQILSEQYLQRVLYFQSDGQVAIEAEHYFSSHEGSHSAEGFVWCDLTDSRTTEVNYMQVLPDDGNNIDVNIETDSPHLSYQIDFNKSGINTTYYLWVKGMAMDSDSNSLHYGLDSVSISSEDANSLQLVASDGFTWVSETNDGSRPTVIIPSAGIYTLDIWMCEDGAKIDRLLLTTDVDYNPETSEPEESPHQPADLTADLNSDGRVNLLDFAIIAEHWREGIE